MALKVKFRTLVPALFQAESPMILTKVGSAYTLSFDAASAPTGPQGEAGPAGASGAGYGGTSSTSLLIANSVSKVFTTQAGLAYQAGAYVRATSRANSANFMEGTITSYTAVTLTIAVTAIGGSGTFADWNLSLAGIPGSVGVSSVAGNTGAFTLGLGLDNDTNEIDLDPSFLARSAGGRLTGLSGAPVPDVDVIGSQNLYYAPYKGKGVPVLTSGKWRIKQFTASSTDQVGLTLALGGSASWAADSVHDVFAVMDSGTLKLATRVWDAGMSPTEVAITNVTTITTGTTPNAWTNPGNAFNGTTSQNSATCAITSGQNASNASFLGQDWGVGVTKTISKVLIYGPSDGGFNNKTMAAFAFWIYGSNDNANWHLINITRCDDTGASGQVVTIPISVSEQTPYRYHRVGFDNNGANNNRCAQIVFYNKVAAANGRRLTWHDGVRVNDASMTGRTGAGSTITVAQYEGKYLGYIHIDTGSNGQITQHFKGGTSRVYGIYNEDNQVPIKLTAYSYATVTSYTPVTSQLWNQIESAVSSGGGITIQAISDNPIKAELRRNVYLNCAAAAASYEAGIGVDTALSFSGMEGSCNIDSTGQAIGFMPTAVCVVPPVAGVRNLYGIERQGNNGAGGQTASTGPRNSYFTAEWMG